MQTSVTPRDIAVELGQPAPEPTSPRYEQWQKWIGRAERAIRRRAESLRVAPDSLNQEDVDEVVTYAVVRRATRPVDGAESTTDQLQVDDGSVNQTRRYGSAVGDIHFLDQWWRILGLLDPHAAGWSGSVGYGRRS